MTTSEVNATLRRLARTYVTPLVRLPYSSEYGAASYALSINDKIGPGVLLMAGVHANETVTPAILLSFAESLCQAIRTGTDLAFGKKIYTTDNVRTVMNALKLVVFPLVNPEGADWQETLTVPWRRNRALNWGLNCRPEYDCQGVDINRNFNFLWQCGFNASPDAWSSKFKGSSAASEPETRNVVWLLDHDGFEINYLLDLHALDQSTAGLVLYPWGDAPNQSRDPNQSFKKKPKCAVVGGEAYGEYIPAVDHAWFKQTAKAVAEACTDAVNYGAKQSYELYPTTGTAGDYAYSRHFADNSKRRVLPLLIETASPFFPAPDEARRVIDEVSAGVFEFLLQCAKDVSRRPPAAARSGSSRTLARPKRKNRGVRPARAARR